MFATPDFTERHEQKLRADLPSIYARLLAIVDQMPILVWTTDNQMRCTAAMGGAGLPAGIKAQDLLGKTVRRILRSDTTAADLSVMGHRRALRGTLARYRLDFGGRVFEASVAPLSGADREIIGTVGAALDVTERHEAEQRAARSQRLLQAVMDKGWEGLVLNDRDGRVMYSNSAALKILGVKEDQLIGRDAGNFVDPRDLPLAENFRDELRKSAGRTLTVEVRLQNPKNHGRWIEYTATNLLDDPNVGAVVGKFRDITARKEAQAKIADLSQRMIRLQQEEERRIARELHDSTSQCLTALLLNLASIKESPDLRRRSRVRLLESLQLARQTASEIRTASYLLHPPTLEEFGVIAALEEYVRGFCERSGIRVRFRRPKHDLERLTSEAEMALFRIVQEGLSNVHRHSSSKQAEVTVLSRAGGLRIEINDRGRGMPKSLLKSLNGQTRVAGAGVGLNGIRERVRQLEGKLEVRDRRPGTGITIDIPLAQNLFHSVFAAGKKNVFAFPKGKTPS